MKTILNPYRLLFLLLCCGCAAAHDPVVVTAVQPAERVQLDETDFVFVNAPRQFAALNDSNMVLRFQHELAVYNIHSGKLLHTADVRKLDTDSILFRYYQAKEPGVTYFSVRNDSSLGMPMEPILIAMHCMPGNTTAAVYAPLGHRQLMDSTLQQQVAASGLHEPLPPGTRTVNIIENKTLLLHFDEQLHLTKAEVIPGPGDAEVKQQHLMANAFSGYCIYNKRLYAPGVDPGGISEPAQVVTAADSAVLLCSAVHNGDCWVPEKTVLATHQVAGYNHPFGEQLVPKCFRVYDDTLFVNGEFGLFTIPAAQHAAFCFPGTPGEKRMHSFARIGNAYATIALKNDSSKTGVVFRIYDARSNKLMLKDELVRCNDIASAGRSFYTITYEHENYYLQRYTAR
jgi:hypothetical protein